MQFTHENSTSRPGALIRATLLVSAMASIPVVVSAQTDRAFLTLDVGASGTATAMGDGADEEDGYWTPDRLRDVQPLPMNVLEPSQVDRVSRDEAGTQREINAGLNVDPISEPGAGPSRRVAPDRQRFLYEPTHDRHARAHSRDLETVEPPTDETGIEPQIHGTEQAHFSSSRVFPRRASIVYPYRTVGTLRFQVAPGEDSFCSAAVIKPRLILTAGHCVHSGFGGQNGFYSKFLFTPAEGTYGTGSAPFDSWRARVVWVTTEWAFGSGIVPNPADFAIIELVDRRIRRDRTRPRRIWRIGNVTGWLGFQTHSLHINHATMLGYPCNIDRCERMHQVTAESFELVFPDNVVYGSDMRGGSSGGPWVQNFGRNPIGVGLNSGQNRVISVTSWGLRVPGSVGGGELGAQQRRLPPDARCRCARRRNNC